MAYKNTMRKIIQGFEGFSLFINLTSDMNRFFAYCSKRFFTQKNRTEKNIVSLLIHFTSEMNRFFAAFSKDFFKFVMLKNTLLCSS